MAPGKHQYLVTGKSPRSPKRVESGHGLITRVTPRQVERCSHRIGDPYARDGRDLVRMQGVVADDQTGLSPPPTHDDLDRLIGFDPPSTVQRGCRDTSDHRLRRCQAESDDAIPQRDLMLGRHVYAAVDGPVPAAEGEGCQLAGGDRFGADERNTHI